MISLLRYPGGKFYMLEDIKEIFNKSGKTTVIDVFGGSGKVLMNLDAKIKVYNDINNNLVNFFTELKNIGCLTFQSKSCNCRTLSMRM